MLAGFCLEQDREDLEIQVMREQPLPARTQRPARTEFGRALEQFLLQRMAVYARRDAFDFSHRQQAETPRAADLASK